MKAFWNWCEIRRILGDDWFLTDTKVWQGSLVLIKWLNGYCSTRAFIKVSNWQSPNEIMNIYVAVQVKSRMWELCNIAPQITCTNLSCEGTDLRTATISKTQQRSKAYKSFFTSEKKADRLRYGNKKKVSTAGIDNAKENTRNFNLRHRSRSVFIQKITIRGYFRFSFGQVWVRAAAFLGKDDLTLGGNLPNKTLLVYIFIRGDDERGESC